MTISHPSTKAQGIIRDRPTPAASHKATSSGHSNQSVPIKEATTRIVVTGKIRI